MYVWLPTVRTGTGTDSFARRLAAALPAYGVEATLTWFPHRQEILAKSAARSAPRGIDLVHANAWHASAFRVPGLPLVITAHTDSDGARHDAHKSWPQRCYHRVVVRPRIAEAVRRSTAITAVSTPIATYYASDFGAKSVQVIGNWLATDALPDAPHSAAPTLLFAGRPGWHKGSDYLPALACAIATRGRLACTLTPAQWPGRRADNVDFLGPLSQAELWSAMRKSMGVVMPSRSEGFGLVALEAMAMGRPVLGFAGTGLDDVVNDGETGALAPIGDIPMLAAAFAHWIASPLEWRHQCVAARARARSLFDESVLLPRYVAVYRAALEGGSRTPR